MILHTAHIKAYENVESVRIFVIEEAQEEKKSEHRTAKHPNYILCNYAPSNIQCNILYEKRARISMRWQNVNAKLCCLYNVIFIVDCNRR